MLYALHYWTVGFKNKSNAIWVTVLYLSLFTTMISTLSHLLNIGVQSGMESAFIFRGLVNPEAGDWNSHCETVYLEVV
jgi:hypothetical protein